MTVRWGCVGGGNRVLSAESQLDSASGPFVAVADRVLSTESQLDSASGPFCDAPTSSSGGASVAAEAMDLGELLSPAICGLLALAANSASVAWPESCSGLGEESWAVALGWVCFWPSLLEVV